MADRTNFVVDFDEQISPYKGATLIIFGGSGDLTKKKLLPSLNKLFMFNLLPKPFHIVCYGRTKFTTKTYKEELCKTEKYDKDFLDIVYYISGQYADCPEIKKIFSVHKKQSLNRIFYLSLPPSEFRNVCEALKDTGQITKNSGSKEFYHTKIGKQPFTRIILEKPFGEDYLSAKKLDRFISNLFNPTQVFCIDHYLGKEPIQNLLFFRFANSIFENLWNSRYIDHIQITINEKIRVGNRAGYFDASGMMKDMVQSHALQILALAMMEAPSDFTSTSIRNEKNKILSSLRCYNSPTEVLSNVVRGQYEGYLQEKGVPPDSKTETFVALKTYVDNWRWSGMPIFIRSGKAMPEKKTELAVYFKEVPYNIFRSSSNVGKIEQNRIVFRIQPETSIQLKVQTKIPGNEIKLISTDMLFPYEDEFRDIDYSNGYDRILFSAVANDASLFLSSQELFSQWKFADSVIDVWKNHSSTVPLYTYSAGSLGPQQIHDLIGKDGKKWN